MAEIIGKVTATESNPTTCTTVRFWVDSKVFIRPFDIVRIVHLSKRAEGSSHSYAMVTELSYITDSAGHLANFISSDFGDVQAKPMNERLGTTLAEATVLGNSEDIELPIRDGAAVEWATESEILKALGLDDLKRPIPAGYMRTSNSQTVAVSFDWQYLIGPEAAHFNISGISGLAAKTSYTMFLLSAIQQKAKQSIQSKDTEGGVSLVVFNVKGADVLAIDEASTKLTETDRAEWRRCNLEPEPLENVTFLYPFAKKPEQTRVLSAVPPDVLERQLQQGKAFRYFYDVNTLIGGDSGDDENAGTGRVSLLLSDIDDPQGTLGSIYGRISTFRCRTWPEFYRELDESKQTGKKDDIQVQSWRRFSRLIASRVKSSDLFAETSTLHDYRQKRIVDALKELRAGHVLVVDIAQLPAYLQYLVVGDVMRTLFDAKLGLNEDIPSSNLGRVIVFVDELNKFAPKTQGGSSESGPLTRWLLDITERGRSLGVVLFGAEQFRSGVHDRVLGNCATAAHGRTNPVELQRAADYRQMLSNSQRENLMRLRQGEMLLQHPLFRTPMVKVQFPKNAYRELKD